MHVKYSTFLMTAFWRKFAILLFIRAHDAWIDLAAWLYATYIAIRVFLIKRQRPRTFLRATLQTHKEVCGLECEDSRDITVILGHFYAIDQVQSVASLCRWCSKFDLQPGILTIEFEKLGQLRRSRIDMNNDVEMNLGVEFTDMRLRLLPSIVI